MANLKKKAKKPKKRDDDELNKMDFWYSWYKWSDCKLAQRYDKERNFFPQPGPSNLNYYEDDILDGYYRPILKNTVKGIERISKSVDKEKWSPPLSTTKKRINNTPPQRYSSRKAKVQKLNNAIVDSPAANVYKSPSTDFDLENDIHVQSFYEQSFVQNVSTPTQQDDEILNGNESDDDISNGVGINSQGESFGNTTISTPIISKFLESIQNSSSELKLKNQRLRPRLKSTHTCVIKPSKRGPHMSHVKEILDSHELPKVIHPNPFYSDPNDVIASNSKKEVGNTILQLTGNALADCDAFESQLNVVGIVKWQRLIGMRALRCSQRILDTKVLENENTIRKFLAKEKPVFITPSYAPPSKREVNNWLNMRMNNSKKKRISDQYPKMNGDHCDSPGEIQRQKTIDALNLSDDAKEKISSPTNGIKNDMMRVLRSKKEITVSLVPKRNKGNILKSQSDDQNKTRIDSDEGDDVVCLHDTEPTKNQLPNSFTKLVCSTR